MQGLMNDHTLYILYDGECFFCTRYMQRLALQNRGYEVQLINAREPHPLVNQARSEGYDLHKGMLVWHQGVAHYAANAMHYLALLPATHEGIMLRIHHFIFSHRFIARTLYPFLVLLRNILLRIRGTPRLR